MAKIFGNVKGFSQALCLLDPEERGDLLFLMAYKDEFEKETNGESTTCSTAALALAAIYHANNEDE